jgi:hypothetical protein
MSRVITKPSEAIPDEYEIEKRGPFDCEEEPLILKFFTPAECAQIAKRYSECSQYVGWIAGEMAEPEAVAELVAWNSLFNSPEWGGKG